MLYIFTKNRYLIYLFLIFSAINIAKSAHIDDPFYITQAKWIVENPTKPMSGSINWMDKTKPFYKENNPPLVPFIFSISINLFGENIFALHLIIALFLAGLIYFLLQIQSITLSYSKTYWVLVFFSPLLLLNQNLMLEIPLNFFLMGAFYYFIRSSNDSKYAYIASVFLSFAILTKYSAIAFLVLPLFYFLKYRKVQYLISYLIIALFIGLWFIWNIQELGKIHILDRQTNIQFEFEKILSFLICLGNIVLFVSYTGFEKLKHGKFIYLILLVGLFIIPSSLYLSNLISRDYYFVAYTVLCVILSFLFIYRLFHLDLKQNHLSIIIFSLLIYTLLIIYSSPFIATRHIIPFILIAGILIAKKAIYPKYLLIFNIIWTLSLGMADVSYSHFYKNSAEELSKKYKNSTIYTLGHNGWQYYSQKNGIIFYDIDSSQPIKGDLTIIPVNTHNQLIDSSLNMKLIEIYAPNPQYIQHLIGRKNAPYGSNYMNFVPFIYSKEAVDSFKIYSIL